MNDTLNKFLFDEDDNLKKDIREKLLDISEEFLEGFDSALTIPVLDIQLVGSNASYNYHEGSDIDLHIITDYSRICSNLTVTTEYLNDEKAIFNNSYNISLKGIDVELYIEDVKSNSTSNGRYSVLNDNWIKFPSKEDIPEVELNQDMYEEYKELADDALESDDSEDIQSAIDQIYMLRKNSIASEGEYGEGNIVFKELRNQGYLDSLREYLYEVKSKELSLENINRR